MARTVYALLVGINAYPVSPLAGCVHDVLAVEEVLKQKTRGSGDVWASSTLLDGQATRDAVVHGLQTHLKRAGPNDTAVFYFSGHGSQQSVPTEMRHLTEDDVCETLVCVDSRTPGQSDLYDKELALLIAEIAEGAGHVVVILDSCHSGSAGRKGDQVIRGETKDTRPATARFAAILAMAQKLKTSLSKGANEKQTWFLPRGRHVLLAACDGREVAIERTFSGQRSGVFSHCLVRALTRCAGLPTYRDLFDEVHADVVNWVCGQNPLLQSALEEDLDRPFLGGEVIERRPHYNVMRGPGNQWQINAGQIHGFRSPTAGGGTRLAIFEPTALMGASLMPCGSAHVTRAWPTISNIDLDPNESCKPPAGGILKATAVSWPEPPMNIAFVGADAGVVELRDALGRAGPDGASSPFLCEDAGAAAYVVETRDDSFCITRAGDRRPVCADVARTDDGAATLITRRLESIARWHQFAERNASPPQPALNDAIALTIWREGGSETISVTTAESEIPFDHPGSAKNPSTSRFKVQLRNRSPHLLYCMLFQLTPGFGIRPLILSDTVGACGRWLEPGGQAWVRDKNDWTEAAFPDVMFQLGWNEARSIVKLVVSTDAADATLLAQDDLFARNGPGVRIRSAPARSAPEPDGSRRGGGGDSGDAEPIRGWGTAQVTLVVHRMQA